MTNEEILAAINASYAKETAPKSVNGEKKTMTQEERLKMYFSTFLPDGVMSGEKTIRLLPFEPDRNSFDSIRFHEMQVDGKWLKLYDPEQDSEPSPLNEIGRELYNSESKEDKDLAKTYFSKEFYIFKVIDRDNEADGPKFWRFKKNYKKDGVLDKLYPLITQMGWLGDPVTGFDITLYLEKVKGNNGRYYTTVKTILPVMPQKPLHEDSEIMKKWLEDEKTWEIAYPKKSFNYLHIVASGGVPKWSPEKKDFINASTEEADLATGDKDSIIVTESSVIDDPQESIPTPDDDLPF